MEQIQAQASEHPSPQPARKCCVLLAEDDADMRCLVAARLRARGHKVIEARDGVEILGRLEESVWSERHDLFDVIVSDINMPALSGLDVLAALRCVNMPTPVILITAYGDGSTHDEAYSLGASAILDKPLDPELLEAAVQHAAPPS